MTTASKSSPSVELNKLQAERDKLHRKVREARRKMDAFDAETPRSASSCRSGSTHTPRTSTALRSA